MVVAVMMLIMFVFSSSGRSLLPKDIFTGEKCHILLTISDMELLQCISSYYLVFLGPKTMRIKTMKGAKTARREKANSNKYNIFSYLYTRVGVKTFPKNSKRRRQNFYGLHKLLICLCDSFTHLLPLSYSLVRMSVGVWNLQ